MSESKSRAPQRRRGRTQPTRLFEFGKYWLAREGGRDQINRYHYDASARRTRRVGLGTSDLEEAKVKLAKHVLTEPPDAPQDPGNVALVSLRHFYLTNKPTLRSKPAAKRAFSLVIAYMKEVPEGPGAPKIGQFGLAHQEAFMRWCHEKHALSAKSISTYLSYLKAACRFAARPRMINDARGIPREVRLLNVVPHIEDGEAYVSTVTQSPRSKPRDWIPEPNELARFIDNIRNEHLFRYVIVALNTWARPEAILELSIKTQVDFGRRMLYLNPPGRLQNNKYRPTIRLTDNLYGWLRHWNLDRPIVWKGEPAKKIDNRTLRKTAVRAKIKGAEHFTLYTLRHYMATKIRTVAGIPVSREERAEWLGHRDQKHSTTQGWYESVDADYLEQPMRATDALLQALDKMCQRSILPPGAVPGTRIQVVQDNANVPASVGAKSKG